MTLMRKDSRRFPGKNLAPLGGKPLYLWTVETALALGYPYTVFHNYEALDLPKGARAVRYAGDGMAMSGLSVLDADVFVMLPATSPFRSVEQLCLAVTDFAGDPVARVGIFARPCVGLYYDEAARPLNFDQAGGMGEHARPRPIYRECGGAFLFRRTQLEQRHVLECEPAERRIYVDPFGVDIDTEADLRAAEAWLASVKEKETRT